MKLKPLLLTFLVISSLEIIAQPPNPGDPVIPSAGADVYHYTYNGLLNAHITEFYNYKKYNYLKVVSSGSGYKKLKIGYSKTNIYGASHYVNYNVVKVKVKPLSNNIDWGKIQFRPNEKRGAKINLGSYLSTASVDDSGFITFTIPLADWGDEREEFNQLQYIAFPYSADAGNFELAIKSIIFSDILGEFQWLGPDKFDNANDGAAVSNSNLTSQVVMLEEDLPQVVSVKLTIGNDTYIDNDMPYSFEVPVEGNNYFVVEVEDDWGESVLKHIDLYSFARKREAKTNSVKEIIVSPNPSYDYFDIKLSNGSDADIHIYDAYGQLKKELTRVMSDVRISDLPSGIYIIHVKTAEGENCIQRHIVK